MRSQNSFLTNNIRNETHELREIYMLCHWAFALNFPNAFLILGAVRAISRNCADFKIGMAWPRNANS